MEWTWTHYRLWFKNGFKKFCIMDYLYIIQYLYQLFLKKIRKISFSSHQPTFMELFWISTNCCQVLLKGIDIHYIYPLRLRNYDLYNIFSRCITLLSPHSLLHPTVVILFNRYFYLLIKFHISFFIFEYI